MVHPGHTRLTRLAVLAALGLGACVGELGYVSGEEEREPPPVPAVAYGGAADLLLATDLAGWLGERARWPALGAPQGGIAGAAEPAAHGALVRVRANTIAAQHPDTLPNGAVLLVERYASPDESALVELAVMQRVEGYDPGRGDWFWAKLDPDLSVVRDEGGRPLAGRVGVGVEAGCSGCHGRAPGGDWVYSNGAVP